MKNSFKTLTKIVVLNCLVILLSTTGIYPQQTKKMIFKKANIALENAKVMQADILSPNEYDKAIDYYQKAERKFDKQKGIDKVDAELT